MIFRRTGACLLALLLASCAEELTLEQQIIGTINEMEAFAEAGERRSFMAMVTEDFSGQLKTLTKEEFRRFMILQWNVNLRLHAALGPIHVRSLGEGMAVADFNGLITGGRGWIPERGQLYKFRTTWLLNGSDWLLATAQWEPIRVD